MRIPFRRLIGCFFLSLIGLLSIANVSVAESYWENARERLRDLQSWDELCEIEDCSQFPEGYATYAIGPDLYYFPHYDTLIEKPPAVYSVRPGRFAEISEDGELFRSFNIATMSLGSGIQLNYCCHYLMQFYGLADTFPIAVRGSVPNQVLTGSLTIRPPDTERGKHQGRMLIDGVLPSEGFWTSFDEVFPDGLEEYNEDFWLVETFEPWGDGRIAFSLISKRPLLQGRHVSVYCTVGCEFWTRSFRADIDSTAPHVSIRWLLGMIADSLFLCEPQQIQDGCEPAPAIFSEIPSALRHIDLLIERVQHYPTLEQNQ